MSFFESQFVKNLEKGQLPEVPVEIETKSIINLSLALLLVGLIIILANSIVKNLSK